MAKYIIKDTGKILSTYRDSNKTLAIHKCKKGYNRVNLTDRYGIKRTYLVHRLIAKKFLPNPHKLPQVNHIDGNKDNNSVSNLQWVTGIQNVKHSVETNLIQRGEDRPNSKLTTKQVKELRALQKEGYNYYELGRMFNIAYQTAHKICTNQTYTHI